MAGPNLEHLEAARLRTGSVDKAERVTTLILMDSANENRVLMFIKCDMNNNCLQAVDIFDNILFKASSLNQVEGEVERTFEPFGELLGNPQLPQSFAAAVLRLHRQPPHLQLTAVISKATSSSPRMEIFSANGEVSSIQTSRCPTCVEIQINRQLSTEQKLLIITLAVKLSINVYKIQELSAPSVRFSKPTSDTFQLMSSYQARTSEMHPLNFYETGMVIRSAGYGGNDVIYCDVLDIENNQVYITADCAMLETTKIESAPKDSSGYFYGQVEFKNKNGQTCFTMFGLLESDYRGSFAVENTSGTYIGTYSNKSFFTGDRKKLNLFVSEKIIEQTGNSSITSKILELFDKKYEKLASIFAEHSTTVVRTHTKLSDRGKMLIMSLAIRTHFVTYGFHKLPMPHIKYVYEFPDDLDQPFLFTPKEKTRCEIS